MLYPVDVHQRSAESKHIVIGESLPSYTTWDEEHTSIFAIHPIHIREALKGGGSAGDTLYLAIAGGTIGLEQLVVSSTLHLHAHEQGIFFLETIPTGEQFAGYPEVYRAAAGPQGFIRFLDNGQAKDPFNTYSSTGSIIKKIRGIVEYHKNADDEEEEMGIGNPKPQPKHTFSVSGFSPTTITAGTHSVLTISGSGFGSSRGSNYVEFSDADDGGATFMQPHETQYVNWSDTEIQVEVPSGAGTGDFRVHVSGTDFPSPSPLTIPYNLSNATYGSPPNDYRVHLGGFDSTHGYTFSYFTDFAANGPAVNDFEWAYNEWRCNTNINWKVGATSTIDVTADDDVNIVRFDNGTEMSTGILGLCRSWRKGCFTAPTPTTQMEWYVEEVDLQFDDGTSWYFGSGTPGGSQYDFRSVVLHELGHAHQLGHVNDNGATMHYSTGPGTTTGRVLTANDINGAQEVIDTSTNIKICSVDSFYTAACAAPVADFGVNSAVCDRAPVSFTDRSTNAPTSWAWDFDNDGITDATTQNPSYTFPSTGTYTVKLEASNEYGTDVITKTNILTVVPPPPATSCGSTPTTTNIGNYNMGIDTVYFAGLVSNSYSLNNDGYTDRSCEQTTTVTKGATYTLRVRLRANANDEYIKVWIDWNNNGVIHDVANELVVFRAGGAGDKDYIFEQNVTVPTSMVDDQMVRMRVLSYYFHDPSKGPCDDSDYGEIEDFGVAALTTVPLPLHLLSFDASHYSKNKNKISWTLSEKADFEEHQLWAGNTRENLSPLSSELIVEEQQHAYTVLHDAYGDMYYQWKAKKEDGELVEGPLRFLPAYKEEVQFSVYPNPSDGVVYLNSTKKDNGQVYTLHLSNMQGQVLLSQRGTLPELEQALNQILEGKGAGAFLLHIQGQDLNYHQNLLLN